MFHQLKKKSTIYHKRKKHVSSKKIRRADVSENDEIKTLEDRAYAINSSEQADV